MSHLATWQGRPRVGIDQAVAAQGWARQTDNPSLRAYAANVAARVFAREGDAHACMRELAQARAELAADTRTVEEGSLTQPPEQADHGDRGRR
jgi:hypothetical protein